MFLSTSMSRFHLPSVAFNLVHVKSLLVEKFNGVILLQDEIQQTLIESTEISANAHEVMHATFIRDEAGVLSRLDDFFLL